MQLKSVITYLVLIRPNFGSLQIKKSVINCEAKDSKTFLAFYVGKVSVSW